MCKKDRYVEWYCDEIVLEITHPIVHDIDISNTGYVVIEHS